MDATSLLAATLSSDQSIREQATAQLQSILDSDYSSYLLALSATLADDESIEAHLRSAAGLAIKNSLSARDQQRQIQFSQRWSNALPAATRDTVKQKALQTLASANRTARLVSAQIVSAIAAIELPIPGQWPTLISTLLGYGGNQQNAGLRQASLQAIGFICESIKPQVLASQSNEILTAVVQGARKEETSVEVQLAAIRALSNSLEFIKDNFAREPERNYIMQVVCEATQSTSSEVQVAAFECLVGIMHLHYEWMKLYMERALFALTILGMKHTNSQVALQAVEFWSTVCDEEIELSLSLADSLDYPSDDPPPTVVSHDFALAALPEILPVMLMLLTRQEEDASEDEWNVSMAAGTALALLAQCTTDAIVAPVIPFVESGIKSPDWRLREAAVIAFGSILDGPDESVLQPLVEQALGTLIEMMRDPSGHVRDTTAWTLGRISDLMVKTIKVDQHLGPMISALLEGLSVGSAGSDEGSTPRIVGNCCWSLMNLAEQLGERDGETCVLSPYYAGIVAALVSLAENNSSESNSRTSAYEALSTLVQHAPKDCLPVVEQLLISILARSEGLLGLFDQLVGMDDKNNYNDLQVNICGAITSIIRRLGPSIKPLSDRIMTLLLRLIQTAGKQSPILEDAFLCIGAVTAALDGAFEPYLSSFLPYLIDALNSHAEYQLCSIAVGLIGDICRALGERSLPYCQGFMEVLLADLQSTILHRSVKPPILSCFGDVALAVGSGFEPFLETTMGVLQQAGAMRADPTNYDLIEYINGLREGILEAYVGIVGGIKSTSSSPTSAPSNPTILLPHINSIFIFLHLALTDQERTEPILRASIGLIGDLAEAFPRGELKELLAAGWVAECLKAGRTKSGGTETKKVAKWAKEMVRRATQ